MGETCYIPTLFYVQRTQIKSFGSSNTKYFIAVTLSSKHSKYCSKETTDTRLDPINIIGAASHIHVSYLNSIWIKIDIEN